MCCSSHSSNPKICGAASLAQPFLRFELLLTAAQSVTPAVGCGPLPLLLLLPWQRQQMYRSLEAAV
jgi:hypothetical protein